MSGKLSALDAWALAQVALGAQTFRELPAVTDRIGALIRQLQIINFRDRQLVARNNLTAREWNQVVSVDPAAPAPVEHSRRWNIYTISDLNNLPPVHWIIPGEIPESSLVVIFGESGAGKSFLSLDYALRISADRNVVYIPTEGVSGYKKRVSAWMKHNNVSREPLIHFIAGAVSLYERDTFEELKHDLKNLKPSVIVVDTLAMAAVGMDENSARDMGIILSSCRALQHELGVTVVLVHHVGAAGLRERGSTALRGNADMMIRVSPADDLVMVECSKTKDEERFATRYMKLLPVATEQGDSAVLVEAKDVIPVKGVLTGNQRKLLELLCLEVNRDGCSMRELQEVSQLPLGTIHRALSSMLKVGYLIKGNGGSYKVTDDGLKMTGDPRDPRDPPVPHIFSVQKTTVDHVDHVDHVDQWISTFGTTEKPNQYNWQMK